MRPKAKNLYKNLPDTPGVYLMRDQRGNLLYVGKAANLRRRVSSYFLRPQETRIERLVSQIAKIDYEKTDTAIEALIREAELIKKEEPPFNIKDKDNKSFLYVQITKEPFPRVLLARGQDIFPRHSERSEESRRAKRAVPKGRDSSGIPRNDKPEVLRTFGPFTSASALREAVKVIRRIFPFSVHKSEERERPCFDYEIGLCPGTCVGAISRTDYRKNIHNLVLFFEGKKARIIGNLEKEMKAAARRTDFEEAGGLRRRIFALRHIQDVAFISEDKVAAPAEEKSVRIEGYDISNISGVSAVGSMVVFLNGKPDKNEYRKFKIRTVAGANDVGMLREVLERRFAHSAPTRYPLLTTHSPRWPLPDMILVDGGVGQVNAARSVLKETNLTIPVIGMAKGPERKRNDVIGLIPKSLKNLDLTTLIRVRDEAHRFAIAYHKNLRGRNFLE